MGNSRPNRSPGLTVGKRDTTSALKNAANTTGRPRRKLRRKLVPATRDLSQEEKRALQDQEKILQRRKAHRLERIQADEERSSGGTRPKKRKEAPKHQKPCSEHEGSCYYPLIHVSDGPGAWYENPEAIRDGGQLTVYVTNNGLRTSSLVVVELYETGWGLYAVPVGDEYDATLNSCGFIQDLHPGETRTITLGWSPDTSTPCTHISIQAYDPVFDPPYPLNYHPSQFPKHHIKHDGCAVER